MADTDATTTKTSATKPQTTTTKTPTAKTVTSKKTTPKKAAPQKATSNTQAPVSSVTESTETESLDTTKNKPEIQPGISKEVIDELSREINTMLSFAVHNGIIINTQVNELIQNSSVDDLINAHNLLCKNIAPATPKSIEFTRKTKVDGKDKSLFNKIPIVRNLIILAILFLIVFIATGQSKMVDNESLDLGMMNNNGTALLMNLAYLSSVAGLGVLFSILKSVSKSVREGTLIPEESVEYATQIVLGIIAGLIMSEVIAFYTTDPEKINLFNKSVLALMGGFSSDALFSILQGIINRVKAIFTVPNS